MKNLYTILILSIVASLSACCTKVDCVFPMEVNIVFHGYSEGELDSLYITGYEKNTDYTVLAIGEYIDSASTHSQYGTADSLRYFYFNTDYDWVLRVGKEEQTYSFDNYTFGKAKCNSCFLGSDKRPIISGYNVNAVYHQGATYDIHK